MFHFNGSNLDKWALRVIVVGLLLLSGLFYRRMTDLDRKMENIAFIQQQQATNIFVIMDAEARIMHFTEPHKFKVVGCPVCHKYLTDWMDKKLKAEYTDRDEHSGLPITPNKND